MTVKNSFKIIFAGTADFAAAHLQALIDHNFSIIAVLTQPDRPVGRGKKIQFSSVKSLALQHDLPVYQPEKLSDSAIQSVLTELKPDLLVVVAYGLLLPQAVLDIPRLGCVNVHASLLPRFRGASPIQQAILSGDAETGVTIMKLVLAMDAGDILSQARCDISNDDTTETLSERLAVLGSNLLLQTLPAIFDGSVASIVQNESEVTYASKIQKTGARLNWSESAVVLDRKIRAFIPWPIAYSELAGERIRIWQAQPMQTVSSKKPGMIVAVNKNGIDVATGEGVLRLQQLQFAGGRVLSIAEALNGKRALFLIGSFFE